MRHSESSDVWERIEAAFHSVGDDLVSVWGQSDGRGGAVLKTLMDIIELHGGHAWSDDFPVVPGIPARFRIKAMERDGMKCVYCGTQKNLRVARLPHAKGLTVRETSDVITLCTSHVWAARTLRLDALKTAAKANAR